MSVTISDVAKRAGVAKSTVSRYLNGGYVSAKSKHLIAQAISETNYAVNLYARGLKNKKSHLIAVIVPRLDSFTAMRMLEGMNQCLKAYPYQMIIIPKNTIDEDEVTYLQKMIQQGVDGIVISAHQISQRHIDLVKQVEIPIIFAGQQNAAVQSFVIDEERIGALVGALVAQSTAQNILYLGVPTTDESVGVRRKAAIMKHIPATKQITCVETGFRLLQAYETYKALAPTVVPDLVIGATDNIALGAMKAAIEQGRVVPTDIQFIGVGDYEVSQYMVPALTTVSIDYIAFGAQLMTAMMTKIGETTTAVPPEIAYTLIERTSTS